MEGIIKISVAVIWCLIALATHESVRTGTRSTTESIINVRNARLYIDAPVLQSTCKQLDTSNCEYDEEE